MPRKSLSCACASSNTGRPATSKTKLSSWDDASSSLPSELHDIMEDEVEAPSAEALRRKDPELLDEVRATR